MSTCKLCDIYTSAQPHEKKALRSAVSAKDEYGKNYIWSADNLAVAVSSTDKAKKDPQNFSVGATTVKKHRNTCGEFK